MAILLNSQVQDLNNYIPWRLFNDLEQLRCQWLWAGNKRFTEPFFDDTIAALKRIPDERPKPVTTLNILPLKAVNEVVSPSAIIFHVSRCGSTLLSQLLASDSKNIVLAEVPFFDDLLRLPFKNQSVKSADVPVFLEAAIKLYAQKNFSEQEQMFIKTDSWHLHFYEQYRALFPSTPFILLGRHPAEVLRSQRKQRGIQSVPGMIEPGVFGFTDDALTEILPERHMINVLASYYRKMIRILKKDPLAWYFDYSEGMIFITKQIYDIAGIKLGNGVTETWENRCSYHAKHPQELFNEKEGDNYLNDPSKHLLDLYIKLKRNLKPAFPSH